MNSTDDLLTALASGPLSAATLLARLGVSRATLSRLVDAAGSEVIRYGNARATSYARRRSVAGQTAWPIHRVEADGRLTSIGVLIPVAASGYLVSLTEQNRYEHFDGLPWWLQDMRPQGFLGRAFAQQKAASLGLPSDVQRWTDDHALIAQGTAGEDCVGNLLVGEGSLTHFLNEPDGPLVERARR